MKKTLISIFSFSTLSFFTTSAHAAPKVGLDSMFAPAGSLPQAGQEGIISTFLGPIISFVPVLTGIAAFITIIIAGIRYISFSANAQEAKKTNDMLTYAVVGLALSAAAFWITRILFYVGGADGLF